MDIAAEFRYRNRADPALSGIEPASEMTARHVNRSRRYRTGEKVARHSRVGVGLVLELAGPVAGALLLGQLSHSGFGGFAPES